MDASVTTRLLAGAPSDGEGRTFDTADEHHRTKQADLSDEGLMTQVCAGSMEALAVLFRRYARLVRTVAMRILRDDSEADDLLQDLFLFVHRNCSMFDSSKSALRSWIVQITYHRAIDRRRYLNSRYFYTRLDLDEATGLSDSGLESKEQTTPLGLLVGSTTMQGLLDSLTEDQRNTLSLHFVDGYSFDEIATKLNQSLGNIRNHYYRGLERLRKQVFPGKLLGLNGYGRK